MLLKIKKAVTLTVQDHTLFLSGNLHMSQWKVPGSFPARHSIVRKVPVLRLCAEQLARAAAKSMPQELKQDHSAKHVVLCLDPIPKAFQVS